MFFYQTRVWAYGNGKYTVRLRLRLAVAGVKGTKAFSAEGVRPGGDCLSYLDRY